MSTNNKQFIAFFINERKKLGLTQQQAADKCGISLKMWGLYERGENIPSGDVLLKFQQIGADVAYIFSGAAKSGAKQEMAFYDVDTRKNTVIKAYDAADEVGRNALLAVAELIQQK